MPCLRQALGDWLQSRILVTPMPRVAPCLCQADLTPGDPFALSSPQSRQRIWGPRACSAGMFDLGPVQYPPVQRYCDRIGYIPFSSTGLEFLKDRNILFI